MRAGRHSRTAEWVAAMRAAHLMYDRPIVFADPLAIRLTSHGWRCALSAPLLYRTAIRALGIARGRATFLARARYTEEKLDTAMQNGITQYVILGAGLDSFAWRRPDLAARLKVYELDHPDSQ